MHERRAELGARERGGLPIGNLVANVSARIGDPGTSGGIGPVGSALTAVAAVCIIALMRSVSARQQAADARLGGQA